MQERNKSRINSVQDTNENYQCHVYDFLFQNEKSQKDIV